MSEGIEGIPQSALMPQPPIEAPPPVEQPPPTPAVVEQPIVEQVQTAETPAPQQVDEKPGLFRLAINKVKDMFGKTSQQAEAIDPLLQKQLSRRAFLKGIAGLGTAAGLELAAEKFFPSLSARALAEKFFKYIEKETVLQKLHTKWDKQDEVARLYQGEHLFELLPPQSELNDYQPNPEEYRSLHDSIQQSELFLQQQFGTAPAWRKNTITYVMINDSILNAYNQNNQEGYVLFADGKLNDKKNSNIIVLVHEVISELNTENKESEDHLIHEMSHAYNDNPNLPIMWNEERAEMTERLLEQEKNPQVHSSTIDIRRTMMTGVNNEEELAGVTYTNADDMAIGYIYSAAGVLFFDWQQANPNFFPKLREQENNFFTANNRLPTSGEWVQIGDTITPGFATWVQSQPALNIPK